MQAKSSGALIARLEQKVDAMHRVIAESEQPTDAKIEHLRADLRATERRLDDRISASERRVIDVVNDKLDQVMAGLDRIANPPK